MITIILNQEREKSLLRKHPWIFNGAIKNVNGKPSNGETVEIFSNDGKFLARGGYSIRSQIACRVWSFDESEEINYDFFHRRLQNAIQLREQLKDKINSNAFRFVNAESDGLPGIVIDKYDEFLVCQFLTAGAEFWKKEIVEQVRKLVLPKGIYERSDVDVRSKEGLEISTRVLFGEEPPEFLQIEESGLKFFVDIKRGHKTGFYLDQRANRNFLSTFCKEKTVLNCFSYTGAFAVHALKGRAEMVTNVDSSMSALEFAEKNVLLNGFSSSQVDNVCGDVFQFLRQCRDSRKQFDVIILDPPKFVDSKNVLEKAARGYKDINLLAFKLLKPNGVLFTFSCSGLMPAELFQKIVADAAVDANRDTQFLFRLGQSCDHPFATGFPEGEYLKGFVCRVK
ncbi:MAG: methyltransferase domain-containing protein [Ignavibacteria bacterium]|nr:methyltransferase domain-containing protein [Ignavibacteria bacterium]